MSFSSVFKKAFIYGIIRFLGRRIEKKHFKRKPVLIVACPRSGTTLLLSVLSAIPNIFAIPKQTYAFDKWENKDGRWMPSRIDKLYREFIYRRIPKSATRWLEKTPGHIRSIDKILDYFDQDVKIIHILRDGRDVTVSTHPAYKDRRVYWVPVDRWVTEVKMGLAFRNHPCVHTLRYEDLIQNFEPEIRKIVAFLDEPFPAQLLNWTAHTQIKNSIHWGGNVQEVHSKSIGTSKRPQHVERVRDFIQNKEAVQLLSDLGYHF